MTIYLSGIQPTGKFHIGNYFGCIKPFLTLSPKISTPRKNIFLIADMHCYTKPENIVSVRINVMEAARSLLAAGINLETTYIVQQSKILEHANLAWYLSCLTKYSRAENMTQFKINVKNHPNVGIFIYPILQAADILIYDPDYVLVGPDQCQHFELAAELAERTNNFSKQVIFKKPKIISSNLRIKSLKSGETKMSKSEPEGCIFLMDDPNSIVKKLMKAKTDNIFGINYDTKHRRELSNLIDVFSLIRNKDVGSTAEELKNCGHLAFKEKLSDELIKYFSEFRHKYNSFTDSFVRNALLEGTHEASRLASLKLESFLTSINK